MKDEKNNEKLDELISQTIGREKPKFEFDKWKQSHKKELEIYESQTIGQKAPRSVRIFEIGRIIMKSRTGKIAAAAVIIITLLLLFNNSQATLYAQVTKAMRKARTIHVVGEYIHNGQWRKNVEIWYQNGVGEKRIVWGENKQTIRIDNGEYIWEHISVNDYALRKKSFGITQLPREILEVEKYLKMCERNPTGDKLINGFQCELYVATRRQDSQGTRVLFWVDDRKRLRRFEEHILKDGQWMDDEYVEVKYDVEFDPNIFVADLGSAVKVIKADEMKADEILVDYFGLEDAVFVREELGFIFAVHELKRCEGDIPYVVCSIRPTEETKSMVRYQGPDVWNYGSFTLGTSWKWIDASSGIDRAYQPMNLAHIYHAGLEAKLALLVPIGSWPENVENCELEVRISVIGDHLRKQMTEVDKRFKPMAVLSLPKEQTSLDEVWEKVYSTAKTLEPTVGFDFLTLKSVPWTDEEMEDYINKFPESGETREYRAGDRSKSARLHHGRTSKPSKISKEDWSKDRMDYLEEIPNR